MQGARAQRQAANQQNPNATTTKRGCKIVRKVWEIFAPALGASCKVSWLAGRAGCEPEPSWQGKKAAPSWPPAQRAGRPAAAATGRADWSSGELRARTSRPSWLASGTCAHVWPPVAIHTFTWPGGFQRPSVQASESLVPTGTASRGPSSEVIGTGARDSRPARLLRPLARAAAVASTACSLRAAAPTWRAWQADFRRRCGPPAGGPKTATVACCWCDDFRLCRPRPGTAAGVGSFMNPLELWERRRPLHRLWSQTHLGRNASPADVATWRNAGRRCRRVAQFEMAISNQGACSWTVGSAAAAARARPAGPQIGPAHSAGWWLWPKRNSFPARLLN